MNNEPVAWIRQSKYGKPIIVQNPCYQFSYQAECAKWDDIPLYTHPVKEYKEPSVKEIEDLWLSVINNIPANDHRPREWHFARAILRKAQEK